MARSWLFALLAAPLALVAGPAAGQASNYDYDRCENANGAFSADEQIAGCTAVIQAPGEIVSNIAASYSNRGNAYAARQDFARALADFDQSLRLDPSSAQTYFNRGTTYYETQANERALVDLGEAIARNPNQPSYYVNRALAHEALEDFERAEADLDSAVRLEPQRWDTWRRRGELRLRRGNYSGARTDLDEAIRLVPFTSGPDAATLFTDRATALLLSNDYAGAIADFNVALQKNVLDTRAILGRATAHYYAGHWQAALDDYGQYAAQDASVAEVWNNRCFARAILGHPRADVLAECDRARQLAPDAWETLSARGFALLRLQDWQAAEANYDAALVSYPDDAPFLYGRGIARVKLGRTSGGEADLAAARRLEPDVAQGFAPFGIAP